MAQRKPLTGIKVLDFTRLFAGPFCTMLLGDLGADVVKVEAPEGDPIRYQGPPFYKNHAFSFLAANRNKRSVVIDMRSAEGKSLALELAQKADVIVENFRPGVMQRMGLGYETLAAKNSRLIFVSMSGFGASGPYSEKGAFDLTIQAEGGYMSITGERNGTPIKLGTSAFDLVCGQYAMSAITTALFDRERTGKGQLIETSLFEGEITYLMDAGMQYLTTGESKGKWGSEHAQLVPYKAFQAADGWVVIGAGVQNLFERFLQVIGRTDLVTDPRFADVKARVANRDEVHKILDAEVRRFKVAEIVEKLDAAKVPCSPINNMEQVFTHPQALHRGMVQKVEHADYGEVNVIGPAVKYGGFDIAADWSAPPLLGEHNDIVKKDWLG
ncbi:MAG TPA: CoA transferase [Xanthobacteraceae bacterium]|nr:CoA transferase [Xanthobacteraceae bacterium]